MTDDPFAALPPQERDLLDVVDAVAQAAARALGPELLGTAGTEGHRQLVLRPSHWPRTAATRPARQRALLHLLAAHPDAAAGMSHVRELVVAEHVTAPPLEGLKALPALEQLSLVGFALKEAFVPPASLSLLALRDASGTLQIAGSSIKRLSLLRARMELLEPRYPQLEVIEGGFVTTAPQVDMPALREAVFMVEDRLDLSRCPALESLVLRGQGKVEGLPALHALRALVSSVVISPSELRLPKLETLELAYLETFGGVPEGGLPALLKVDLSGTRLRDVEGLGAAAPKLAELNLSGCRELGDLSGLADHPALRVLQLRHCKKARPLALGVLPALEHLQLGSTPWKAKDIAEANHHAVVPRSKVAKRKKRASSAKAPARRGGAVGKQVARLRKLLVSRDLDSIRQGAELAAPLDAEVFDALLEGTAIEEKHRGLRLFGLPPSQAVQRFVPNRTFTYRSTQTGPYREAALRALVAVAPGGVGAELRAGIRSLRLDARIKRYQAAPIDLVPLTRFEDLHTLAIEYGFPLRAPERLAELPALRTLWFGATNWRDGPLTLPASLRALRVSDLGGCDFVGDGSSWGALTHLDLTGPAPHAETIGWEPLRSLRWLRWGALRDTPDYRKLGALTRLEALDPHNATDLAFLAELPALRHLVLPHQTRTSDLPSLPDLEVLEVTNASPADALERCPGLKSVLVRGHGEGFDPTALSDAGVRVQLDEWASARVPKNRHRLVEWLAAE